MIIAEVLILLPPPMGGIYDYQLPAHFDPTPGVRVSVPFGKTQQTGIFLTQKPMSLLPNEALKSVTGVLDDFIFPMPLLRLLEWIQRYYHCSMAQCWRLVYAKPILKASSLTTDQKTYAITPTGRKHLQNIRSNAKRQIQLLSALTDGPIDADLIHTQALKTVIKQALDQVWIESQKRPALPPPQSTPIELPPLNAEQQRVVKLFLQPNKLKIGLLEGVTGSGKTRVYQHLVAHHLAQDKQCLLLIPEIALTQQNLTQFKRLFQHKVRLYHSGISDKQRKQAWVDAISGSPCVFIGTRSAVFLPLKSESLLIIDEEHDASYEHQGAPFYNARNLLIMRAKFANSLVLLASATPSLESLKNALSGHYQHLTLTQKATQVFPPVITPIDVKGQKLSHGLSEPLMDLMQQHLTLGKQVMLFLNRRGYAPVIICHACGFIKRCPDCGRPPTYHKHNNTLHCHHCQWQQKLPSACPDCQKSDWKTLGYGTAKLEHYLKQRFAEYTVLRIDKDSIKKASDMDAALDRIRANEVQIILGTQMLSKGHDLPNLSLAVIVNADQGLMSMDFRATEHIAQLFEQVAGRSGRHQQGTIAIQTHDPHHPLIQQWIKEGYLGISRQLLAERKNSLLPPYVYQALIRCESKYSVKAQQTLEILVKQVQNKHVFISPPTMAQMEKRKGRYQWLILLESDLRSELHHATAQMYQHLTQHYLPKNIRWSIDVDPIQTL